MELESILLNEVSQKEEKYKWNIFKNIVRE